MTGSITVTAPETNAERAKRAGIHYTPPPLADFLARRALSIGPPSDALHVLDPACGDGELLAAIGRCRAGGLVLTGLDTDPLAVARASERLSALEPAVEVRVRQGNFLEEVAADPARRGLFDDGHPSRTSSFDMVIANPPYVRTQVLGAATSRALASRFQLSGRVDLYQAFVVGIGEVLRNGGVLALLCSNRFMTTKSGRDLRRRLATTFEIEDVYDLGDTKLFSAAVLPAVVMARKSPAGSTSFSMTSVYEKDHERAASAQPYRSISDALVAAEQGVIEVGGKHFTIRRGVIECSDVERPWVAVSEAEASFVERLAASTQHCFGDVAKVRVGIKTTCDRVFIRSDWDAVGKERRPEPEVLLSLLTHDVAAPWRAAHPKHRVLYPYDLASERRRPLDLGLLPRTAAYLEAHRKELVSRGYVVSAGRLWWEIWVPQRPALWRLPKIVFPDISEVPKFWLDESGAVVNGDCYWMTVPSADPSIGVLMLAVANSSLAVRFYDYVCGNRLYAGRRRYITQYVERFPLPVLDSSESQKVVRAAKAMLARPPADVLGLADEIDYLVWRAFGFEEPFR